MAIVEIRRSADPRLARERLRGKCICDLKVVQGRARKLMANNSCRRNVHCLGTLVQYYAAKNHCTNYTINEEKCQIRPDAVSST